MTTTSINAALATETFIWTIKDPETIQQIQNSKKRGEQVISPYFMLHGWQWGLFFTKKDKKNIGQARLHLRLIDLPPKLSQITIFRETYIKELNINHAVKATYNKSCLSHSWARNTSLLSDVMHMEFNQLTIESKITLIKVCDRKVKPDTNGPTTNVKFNNTQNNSNNNKNNFQSNNMNTMNIMNNMGHVTYNNNTLSHCNSTSSNEEDASSKVTFNQLVTTIKDLRLEIDDMKAILYKNQISNENKSCDSNTIDIVEMNKNMDILKIDVDLLMGQNNDNILANKNRRQVKLWYQKNIKLPRYYQTFVDHGFESIDVIKLIKLDQLKLMGIHKLGHIMLMLNAIRKLNN